MTPKSSMASATPPVVIPPPGMPPATVFGPRLDQRLPPMFGGGPSPQMQLLEANHVKYLTESLVRAENACKAAMQQCITNARNLQNELVVIQEALVVLRGASGI